MDDPLDIRGQEVRAKRSADEQRRRAEQQVADLRLLAQAPGEPGRAFEDLARWLIDFTGVYRSSMTGNAQTYFLEGQRNVGLAFVALVAQAAPDLLTKLLQKQATHDRPDSNTANRAAS